MKAIETQYKGYRFRSRLEARWAVFFDALGIEWIYEPEGFDLGKLGWYLPDFWLPGMQYWIEIKGKRTASDKEWNKAWRLAKESNQEVYILGGNIGIPTRSNDYKIYKPFCVLRFSVLGNHRGYTYAIWVECPYCKRVEIDYQGVHFDCLKKYGSGKSPLNLDCQGPRLMNAYRAARSARFEFGESGQMTSVTCL